MRHPEIHLSSIFFSSPHFGIPPFHPRTDCLPPLGRTSADVNKLCTLSFALAEIFEDSIRVAVFLLFWECDSRAASLRSAPRRIRWLHIANLPGNYSLSSRLALIAISPRRLWCIQEGGVEVSDVRLFQFQVHGAER